MQDKYPQFEVIEDKPPKRKRKLPYLYIPWRWVGVSFAGGLILALGLLLLLSRNAPGSPAPLPVLATPIPIPAPSGTPPPRPVFPESPTMTPAVSNSQSPFERWDFIQDVVRSGPWMAVASRMQLWVYFDGQPYQQLATYDPSRGYPYLRAAFNPNGRQLAVVEAGNNDSGATITLWNTADWQVEREWTPHSSILHLGLGHAALAYSPDGALLASGAGGQGVFLWDSASGQERGRLNTGADGTVSLAFSADGSRLITLMNLPGWQANYSRPMRLQVWDVSEPTAPTRIHEHPFDSYEDSIAYSPDGRRLVFYSPANVLELWDVEANRLIGQLSFDAATSGLQGLTLSPEGSRLAFIQERHFLASDSNQMSTGELTLRIIDWAVSDGNFNWQEMGEPRPLGSVLPVLSFWRNPGGLWLDYVADSGLIEWNLDTDEKRTLSM
jgi:WD40 repeat protein